MERRPNALAIHVLWGVNLRLTHAMVRWALAREKDGGDPAAVEQLEELRAATEANLLTAARNLRAVVERDR